MAAPVALTSASSPDLEPRHARDVSLPSFANAVRPQLYIGGAATADWKLESLQGSPSSSSPYTSCSAASSSSSRQTFPSFAGIATNKLLVSPIEDGTRSTNINPRSWIQASFTCICNRLMQSQKSVGSEDRSPSLPSPGSTKVTSGHWRGKSSTSSSGWSTKSHSRAASEFSSEMAVVLKQTVSVGRSHIPFYPCFCPRISV